MTTFKYPKTEAERRARLAQVKEIARQNSTKRNPLDERERVEWRRAEALSFVLEATARLREASKVAEADGLAGALEDGRIADDLSANADRIREQHALDGVQVDGTRRDNGR
jgi:hypothetical protein